ncbi:hypothetical protein MKW98_003001 [Papaver atlanticum]|uniref:Uncharacterized protein n=1 Tax=Papaver atlanticum TaxID=357466 RepID=A0AAD4XW34_9MAGN|nr:hypothetical protein MKW98_003001 [Papaver atlanticum]
MNWYNLCPNGGILTSTKFDEVVSVIEKRADQLDYVLVDTPAYSTRPDCLRFWPLTRLTRLSMSLLWRKNLDKRREEKQRLEEEPRQQNVDKLRKDMEKSGLESVVLSIVLKDKLCTSKSRMDEDEDGR